MKLKLLLLLCLFTLQTNLSNGQQLYNREFRGVWMATVGNIDWPVQGAGAESQKTALRNQFDRMKEANINVIFFQVRTEADALYRSTKEPWSRFLTGVQGRDPGYDPLEFAIEEAHKRGMELHAWFNPYRVNYSTSSSIVYDEQHVSRSKPEWILEVNGKKILNPGLPVVRDYVTSVIMDVVDNYLVDGVHFDDYFYQYPPDQISNQDNATYQQYKGSFTNVGDWRRDNVNRMMKQINDAINASKPDVRFGISPFGIWRNGVPSGITGMDAYNVIYADPVNWLQNKTLDYITPQLYWRIGGSQDFRKLIDWWSTQAFQNDRHLYTGHILSQTGYTSEEVPNQIAITREPQYRAKNSYGSVHFRSALIAGNTMGIQANMKNSIYKYPAVPPLMEWKPGETPVAPSTLTYTKNDQTGDYTFTWNRAAANTHAFKRFVLYTTQGTVPATAAAIPDGSVRALTANEEFVVKSVDLPMGESKWVVTELGLGNAESNLSNVVTINKTEAGPATPVVVSPTAVNDGTSNTFFRFQWESPSADLAGFHYQWSTSPTFATILEENSTVAAATTSKIFSNLTANTYYYFRIRGRNAFSWSEWSPTYSIQAFPLGISALVDEEQIKIYPNPSNSQFTVDLYLKKAAQVRVDLVGMDGQSRFKNSSRKYPAGQQTIKINRGKLPAGVYVLKLQIDGLVSTHRVILL